jgi:hypothetical protein
MRNVSNFSRDELIEEIRRLDALLNNPFNDDWFEGVEREAGHQIDRHGTEHDEGKTPFDWFWLVGYLCQKAAAAHVAGDLEKAKHHTISTGAAMLNWWRSLTGENKRMRPGIARRHARMLNHANATRRARADG